MFWKLRRSVTIVACWVVGAKKFSNRYTEVTYP